MDFYEIRIMSSRGGVGLTYEAPYLSDQTAINAAFAMAANQGFEVWRDLDCLCRIPRYEPAATRAA
jgi:hypothetical protein